MKRVGKTGFFAVLLLILTLAYLAAFGLSLSDGTVIVRGAEDIRWGMDVKGGISVTFGPAEDAKGLADGARTEEAARIISERLESRGVTGHQIYTDTTNARLIVSVPNHGGDAQSMDDLIAYMSSVSFVNVVEGRLGAKSLVVSYEDSYGRPICVDSSGIKHRMTLDSSSVASAQKIKDENGDTAVRLNFTDEGEKLLLESTGRLTAHSEHSSERYLTICVDGRAVSEMYVEGVCDTATISRRGGLSDQEAEDLVIRLSSGALPFELQVMDYELLDATLGEDSVTVMLVAGTVAFALICLFMIVRYRLPGVVACVALLGQVAGILACVTGFFPVFDSFTLTLPGVAGIILSIGMGVDANIITGERVAEEVRKGKTIEGAIDAGNENSFSSIFDGNVTVLIVSVILMGVFGPPGTVWSYIFKPVTWMLPVSTVNAIYAFGYTLFAGVIFNFIMGVVASRIMLRSLSGFPALQNRRLYGGGEQ